MFPYFPMFFSLNLSSHRWMTALFMGRAGTSVARERDLCRAGTRGAAVWLLLWSGRVGNQRAGDPAKGALSNSQQPFDVQMWHVSQCSLHMLGKSIKSLCTWVLVCFLHGMAENRWTVPLLLLHEIVCKQIWPPWPLCHLEPVCDWQRKCWKHII